MRVLMLSDLYPPFIGGVEQHVRNLSHGLAQRGHDVSVATIDAAGHGATELDNGVRVHRIRATTQRAASTINQSGRPYAPPFPDPEVVVALRRIVGQDKPDVVHAHNWMLHSFLPLKAWSGARLVVTLHDYGIVCAKRSLMYGSGVCTGPGFSKCLKCAAHNYGTARGLLITMANWATLPVQLAAVDQYLPVSNSVAIGNDLSRHGAQYEVLPNFVPDDVELRSDPAHPALAHLPDGPFWLYVGALRPHKGVDVLLEAYGGLAGAPPLVLIGTRWPDTPKTFPPGTTVIESIPHPAVMAAWRRSTVGLVPSVFPDPCPTVAMEAMACGVPVIGSDIGGLPDLVDDGVTGMLVAPGNPVALRTALSSLAGQSARIEAMRGAARAKLRSFTATAVVDRLEEVYSRLLRPA
jgi:glycosyltransferase involved in cell wall biosynthesis